MTPANIIREAQADGVRLAPSPTGAIKATEDSAAVNRWLAVIREREAAERGEIVASLNYEPIRKLPRRGEGYAPGAAGADRRTGRERWPGLTQKGGE
jgi:hypothetical protein